MESRDTKKLHYLSSKYNEYNMPLYLSYPIEANWKNKREEASLSGIMGESQDVDMYIHFPFCKQVCYFCCCEKIITQKQENIEHYLLMLNHEMNVRMGKQAEKKKVSNMHWGGGTPTMMSVQQMEKLWENIEHYFFMEKAEYVNIEAYPDAEMLTKEKLKFLKERGFTSISFGIQDFDRRVQEAIHRQGSIEETRKLIEMARAAGLQIHIDLCYGLPYQGLNEFEQTLEVMKVFAPERIVIYPYAHYPFLFPLQRKIPDLSIPNVFIKTMLMNLANTILADSYEKYGMDTFIKKGSKEQERWRKSKIVRDFMGTNVCTQNVLYGLGSSAISRTGEVMIKNTGQVAFYESELQENQWPIEKMHRMTKDDRIRNDLIQNHLLGTGRLDFEELEKAYQISFSDYFAKEIEEVEQLVKDELIEWEAEGVLRMTKYGILFPRTIAHIFNHYYVRR